MAEDLNIHTGTKQEQYEALIPQIAGLLQGETNLIANLANMSAALKEQFNWWWVGFYWIHDDALVLGPFQGPVACTRIKKGRGVCGSAWEKGATIIVADVEKFPGHIACSALSNAEIVVPCVRNNEVYAVLDIDSTEFGAFDNVDATYLEELVSYL